MQRSIVWALAAIGLWGSLAALGVRLAHLPPLWLTGVALGLGSLLALPLGGWRWAALRVSGSALALGVYGLLGFHLLLFLALRWAPPVQANLINYLWPLLIVLLAPLFQPVLQLRAAHALGALMGLAGAAWVILGRGGTPAGGAAGVYPMAGWGYAAASASAFIWASYSLATRRLAALPSASVGTFAAASGALALLAHALLEPAAQPSAADWGWIVLIGLGPMGAAFYLWDAALKNGDARHIGVLSYLTPLLSTVVLVLSRSAGVPWVVWPAGALIVGGALIGTRAH